MGGKSTKEARSGPKSAGYKSAMAAFEAKQREGFAELSVIRAGELISDDAYMNYTLVDARSREEMSVSMLPGAIRLDEFLGGPTPNGKIVFYCVMGVRAGAAAQDYARKVPSVADNVVVFAGSLCGWTHFGGKLVDDAGKDTKRVHAWGKANVDFFPSTYEIVCDPPPHTSCSREGPGLHGPSNSEMYAEAKRLFDSDILPRLSGLTLIEAEELLRNDVYKQYVLVDVRSLEERMVSTIPGSVPVDAFLENERPAGKKIVFFCNFGGRAGATAQEYLHHHPQAEDVMSLKLSLLGWAHNNGPFVDAQGNATKKVHSTKTLFPREFDMVHVPAPVTKPANNFSDAHSSHKPIRKQSQNSQKSSPKSAKKRSSGINRERYADASSWFESVVLPTQSGIIQIDAEELLQGDAYKQYTMVDCRTLEEMKVSTIPGAVALDTFISQHSQRQHKKIVFYCTVGARSGTSASEYSKHHPDAEIANFRLSLLGWCHNDGPLDADGASTKKVHCWGDQQKKMFPVDTYDVVIEPAPATKPIADFGATSVSDKAPAKEFAASASESRDVAPPSESDGESENREKGGKGYKGKSKGKGKKGKGKGKGKGKDKGNGKEKGKKGKYVEANWHSDWYSSV